VFNSQKANISVEIVSMFVPVGLRRRRRKESRLERARREGNVEERAREREAVA